MKLVKRVATWAQKFRNRSTEPADLMLARELVADVVQGSLKFCAFWLSGSHAMKAELMRASVDSLNHVTLFAVSRYAKSPPDIHHNYGYDRYKNIVAFLPSALFLASGVYNVVMPIMGIAEQELTLTGLSLSVWARQAISLCSFGEFYLFFKNLGDIDTNPPSSFLRTFYRRVLLAMKILTRKQPADPIQVMVVSENVISVVGMSLPLLSSFIAYFTGFNWLDTASGVVNGSIQIYLAWHIFWDNTKILAGKSLTLEETFVCAR